MAAGGSLAMQEAAERLLTAAQREPAGLLVEGEAGIGKTTAWLNVLDAASRRGFRVLSARGHQTESVLAYAAVADLLADIDTATIDELPRLQQLAVNRVLFRADGDGPPIDHRVVAAAVGTLLEHLAAAAPLLVAIDDVQWLDASSRVVLGFVIRRLRGRIGVLATERCDPGRSRAEEWLTLGSAEQMARIRLQPLTLGALHQLLLQRIGHSFSRVVLVRIAEISGGNPFYALELARVIDGGEPPAGPGLPATLAELVRMRVGRLDGDLRRVLLAAASVAAPTVDLLAGVTDSTVEHVMEVLEAVESDGVVEIEGSRVRFTHPLLAYGVYSEASAGSRRAMHRALAAVEVHPELKARHLALAATTADEATFATLDSAAEATRHRGAPAAAAELLELVINLGGGTPMRRMRAAEHHLRAGNTQRAAEVLRPALVELEDGPLRALALILHGGILVYENTFDEAAVQLGRALDNAADHPAIRVRALLMLSFAQATATHYEAALRNAIEGTAIADSLEDPGLISQALATYVTVNALYGNGIDETALERALQLDDETSDAPVPLCPRAAALQVLAWAGDFGAARAYAESLRRSCEERGSDSEILFIAIHATLMEIWQSRFAEAARIAEDSIQRAQQLGGDHPLAIAGIVTAAVSAFTGREQDARDAAHSALVAARRCGAPGVENWAHMILGFLEVSLGNHAEAIRHFEPGLAGLGSTPPGTELITAWWVPYAAEAMINLGNVTDAAAVLDLLESNGRRLDRAWMIAAALRCRAMLAATKGVLTEAEKLAREALAEHERTAMPFELARTRLLLGQLQRRQRLKEAAANTLRETLEIFEDKGASIWAERTRAELSRAKSSRAGESVLTSTEQRVAELAATGMTNRDIASTLFISAKTVEHHLSRVYRKLGIRTRAELGRRMAPHS
ncbi:hypothetical protein AU190_21945 [Mycolicibacterium acapulense]|nr:hypothetical protein AU190_21945 [Mycolicibacterium acapulense]